MTKILRDARFLWQLCFPTDSDEFCDFYFGKVASDLDTYIDYDQEGQPLTHIGILRAQCPTNPSATPLKVAYISGACTHPDHWGQGLMSQLMHRVITAEQELGTDALILIPASDKLREYYRRHFGFEDAAPKYTLPLRDAVDLLKLHPRSKVTSSKDKLLIHSSHAYPSLIFSPSHAQLQLSAYQSLTDYFCIDSLGGARSSELVLGRRESGKIEIDWLITQSRQSLQTLLQLLQTDSKIPITVNNLSLEDLKGTAIDNPHLKAEPWGMYLPLSDNDATGHLKELLVCHFFE